MVYMEEKRIVRINVEIVYDDGTLDELKVAEPINSSPRLVQDFAGDRPGLKWLGDVLCVPQ